MTTEAPVVETPTIAPGQETAAGGAAPPVVTQQPPAVQTPPATQTEKPAVAEWPEDWRNRLAGEDKSQLTQLERLPSMEDFYKSHRALQQKFSSGEYKRDMPKDATPEQIAEWRKERGIPEKPESYIEALKLPNGVVPGAADKPLVESFAKAAMDKNWTTQQYNDAVSWYYDQQSAIVAKQQEDDGTYYDQAINSLRTEWGNDYKRNMNAVANLAHSMPKEVFGKLLAGRSPDGRKLGDDPDVIKYLAHLSRELNPASTLVPAGTTNEPAAISDRLKTLNNMIADQPSGSRAAYYKDEALQAEYRNLLEAQIKLSKRSAA